MREKNSRISYFTSVYLLTRKVFFSCCIAIPLPGINWLDHKAAVLHAYPFPVRLLFVVDFFAYYNFSQKNIAT